MHVISIRVRHIIVVTSIVAWQNSVLPWRAGQEKVGVAGRTGCGKSTLMMTLKRIVEPSGGRILIDGVDIGGVSLFDLRSRLALVPQVWHDRRRDLRYD